MARRKPLLLVAVVAAVVAASWVVTTALARRAGQLGMNFHANGQSAEAERAYSAAERLSLGTGPWTYYRAVLLAERGEHDAALSAFRKVVDANPNHGLAWLYIADISFKQGRIDEARDAYQRVLAAPQLPGVTTPDGTRRKTMPLRTYAEAGLARLAHETGTPSESPERRDAGAYVPPADPLIDAMVAQSDNTDVLLKHAALAARSGDHAWRQYLAERAFRLQPEALDVLLEMSSVRQATGDHRGALEYLERAAALAPDDHHTHVQMGRSLTEVGRLAEAEQVLRRAARVRDAAAEYNLALVLDRQGRWDEARQHYEQALAINPFHVKAMNNLAIGLDQRGQTGAAFAWYDRAIQTSPSDPEAHSNLGAALIGQRRFDEAIRVLRTAIELNPGAADAYNNLGIALAFSGRLDEARKRFEEALRRAPGHVDATRNLARLEGIPR